MSAAKAALDPLWQCLCPSWTPASLARTGRLLHRPGRREQRLRFSASRPLPNQARLDAASLHHGDRTYNPLEGNNHRVYGYEPRAPKRTNALKTMQHLEQDDTDLIYARLRTAAAQGHTKPCRDIARFLVKERRETPNVQIYNALIASNVNHELGAAWRVAEYLDEMTADGLQPDVGTCHAVLKVVSVHLDHLLRADVLDYMRKRWFQLSEDGAHDVVAGLLRDALFEQALHRLDAMRQEQMRVEPWLYDMAVFVLCEAGEIEEAYRIMRMRFDDGERNLRRSVWSFLLDKASEYRHHDATSLVWTSQVNPGYLNPSSGTCMNILATAANAGDAAMATEVFSHLSKRGTAYKPNHFEFLVQAYLSAKPPDAHRALSILTIMPMEKLEPDLAQTRSLYLYLRDKPNHVRDALLQLRELHQQGRKIPIAILNLLVECLVEQNNLDEAMKIYKLIHTFAPIGQGAQKSFANIETFNLLLKGCRTSNPPDAGRASFLVSELLALRVIPKSLTYDRLILVYSEAAKHAVRNAREEPDHQHAAKLREQGLQWLDWSFRHLTDMQRLSWIPRFGTLELLAVELAGIGDERCWDVLQCAEDQGENIEGFAQKARFLRKDVEQAWSTHRQQNPPHSDAEPESSPPSHAG